MPKLLEPLLIQSITARFRSLNVVASNNATATTTGTISIPMLTPTRSIPAVSSSAVIRSITTPPMPAVTMPVTGVTAGTPLVQAPSRSAADVQLQAQASDELTKYIAAISHAIVIAHDGWRTRAFLKGVQINGVTALGGTASGPLLSEMLIPNGPTQGMWGNATAYTAAIANGLASAWREWEQSLRVPGLAWYPTFAAVPAPQAPPTPNVPTPLATLASNSAVLASDYLSSSIIRKLAKPGPYSDPLFKSVADGFSKAVTSWMSTQAVTNVLGTGPVPSFAPPYIPVAPVIGGSIIEGGPHFAA